MIPKIIHYCWFGGGEMPQEFQKYIDGWHRLMPDYNFKKWSEDTFDISSAPRYVVEAYNARKYAFVSDYVRLWALEREGGIYLDTDVEVLRPFDSLLNDVAFVGFEESLAHLPGTCVMGCEAHCKWVKDMLIAYEGISFIKPDGSYDVTTNTVRLGMKMVQGGLIADGREQLVSDWELKVYPFYYFSPITSTRVMRKKSETYSIHHFAESWKESSTRSFFLNTVVVRETINAMVQLKRLVMRIK